jgi:uncharacterized membrane protein YphA (DoxX/SURF4 family)
VSYLLWTLQALLAALFLMAGAMKLVTPADALTEMIPLPELLIRVVGTAECLGALGLILPGLLKIRPGLTVIAAVELIHIMVGATIVTLVTQDALSALMPVAVGAIAAFIAYGRTYLVPFASAPHGRQLTARAAA